MVYTMEYDSVIKKELNFAISNNTDELEISTRNKSEKDKYCMVLLICEI